MTDKPAGNTEFLTLEALIAVAAAISDIENYILFMELGEGEQKMAAMKSLHDKRGDLLKAIRNLLETVKSNGNSGS